MNRLTLLLLLFLPLSIKAFKSFPGTPITPPDTLSSCDTLWLKSGKIKICTILSDDGKEIKFTDCPASEIVSTIPKTSTKLSPSDSMRKANMVMLCDSIYLKDGEVVPARVKYVTKRKVVYTGCCPDCATEKIIKMEFVSDVAYSQEEEIQPQLETKPPPPTITYSEEEKASFGKKKKLFGILALSAGGLAVSAIAVMAAVTTITFAITIAIGVMAFAFVIAALIFSIGYVRNKNKLKA